MKPTKPDGSPAEMALWRLYEKARKASLPSQKKEADDDYEIVRRELR